MSTIVENVGGYDSQVYSNHLHEIVETIKNRSQNLVNFSPLLPLVFNLKGEPYTLKKYFVFEPFFNARIAQNSIWKTARQVSKSTSSAAESILRAGMLPHYNILHVTPYSDMIARFSGNYIYDFLKYSPVQSYFLGDQPLSKKQVTFRSGSRLLFSFASDDCTRIRGINANSVHYDEWQSFDPSFEPEINATTSAAEYPVIQKTGTPLTLDNQIEADWEKSSQAEWVIRCSHCSSLNIPSKDEHLDAMLGPRNPKWEVSPDQPAIVCHHCGKWLHPQDGCWVHRYPERRKNFVGYHVPQIVMPFHCESPSKWATLQNYRAGANQFTTAKFYNEICGESFDEGSKLVTITDLKRVSTLGVNLYSDNPIQDALDLIKSKNYRDLALGIDWGGGGQDHTSFTVVAVVGITAGGEIQVPWAWRSLTPNEPTLEAQRVKWLFHKFNANFIAHDFCGSGSIREIVLSELGIPVHNIAPVMYFRTTSNPLVEKKVNTDKTACVRDYYAIQKARSLTLLCAAIRAGKIKFFDYDYKDTENTGLLYDFMSLIEEKTDGRGGGDTYHIIRSPKLGPDDFVHAVNYAAMLLYSKYNVWPDLSKLITQRIDTNLSVNEESFK